MANDLFEESLAGTDGNALTVAAGITNISGTGTATHKDYDGKSWVEVVCGGTDNLIVSLDFTSVARAYVSMYVQIPTVPAGNTYFQSVNDGATKLGDVRIEPVDNSPSPSTFGVAARDQNISVGSSGQLVTIPNEARIDTLYDPANDLIECYVFTGAQLHNTLAQGESGNSTGVMDNVVATTLDDVRFGILSNASGTIRFRRLHGSSTEWPPPETPATTPGKPYRRTYQGGGHLDPANWT